MLKGPFNSTSPLLIPESPMQFLPALGALIGSDAALVLQQIQYWLNHSNNVIDGEKWIYNSIDQWHLQFYWIQRRTLQRYFSTLQNFSYDGNVYHIIKVRGQNKTSPTKWYTINYEALNELYPIIVGKSIENRKRIVEQSKQLSSNKEQVFAQYPELSVPLEEAVASVIGGMPLSPSLCQNGTSAESSLCQNGASFPNPPPLRQSGVSDVPKKENGETTGLDTDFPVVFEPLRQNGASLCQKEKIIAPKKENGENTSISANFPTEDDVSLRQDVASLRQAVTSLCQNVASLCQDVASLRQNVLPTNNTTDYPEDYQKSSHRYNNADAPSMVTSSGISNFAEKNMSVVDYVLTQFKKAVRPAMTIDEQDKLRSLVYCHGAEKVLHAIELTSRNGKNNVPISYLSAIIENDFVPPRYSKSNAPDSRGHRERTVSYGKLAKSYRDSAAAQQSAIFRSFGI